MADVAARRRRNRSQRRVVAAGAGLAVVAAGGGVAWALTGPSGPSYRLATATRATVAQTVTTTGTIAAVSNAIAHFPVAGTVASVAVTVGEQVHAGQTLAMLDPSDLEQQVQSAKAALAAAQQTLARDQSGQTGGGSNSGSSGSSGSSGNQSADSASATPLATSTPKPSASSGTGGNGSAPGGGSGSTAELVAEVRRAQQQLLADQHAVDLDADVVAADKAIVAENAACQALLDATATPTASPSPTSTGTPTAPASASATTADDLQSCQAAIAAVQAAQQQVQHDISSLTGDEKALDSAVNALLAALAKAPANGSSATSGAARSSAGGSDAKASANSGANGSSSNSGVASAAQLAADQQRIDAANAEVTVAQQNLQQATLTTPIDGTVAAVALSSGQSVSAASSTATITIVGHGQQAVHTTVGINDIDHVKVGEQATVTVDGVSTPLTGRVSLVGLLNSSGTSGTSTTYPVTIVLDTTKQLYSGAGATVAIDVGAAKDVLTVPASAIHGTGTATTVLVLRNGKPVTQRVTLGVRGLDRVQVTTGLSAGDQVVLADVSAAIPSATNNNRFGRLGGGGLGGANLGGGGAVVLPGGGVKPATGK